MPDQVGSSAKRGRSIANLPRSQPKSFPDVPMRFPVRWPDPVLRRKSLRVLSPCRHGSSPNCQNGEPDNIGEGAVQGVARSKPAICEPFSSREMVIGPEPQPRSKTRSPRILIRKPPDAQYPWPGLHLIAQHWPLEIRIEEDLLAPSESHTLAIG